MQKLNWKKYAGDRIEKAGERASIPEEASIFGHRQYACIWETGFADDYAGYIEIPIPGEVLDVECGPFKSRKEARAAMGNMLRCKHGNGDELPDGSLHCPDCDLKIEGAVLEAIANRHVSDCSCFVCACVKANWEAAAESVPPIPETHLDSVPNRRRLAAEFARQMCEAATAEELDQINRLNNKELNVSICHSHDFFDANMIMLEAWQCALPSVDFDPRSDDQAELWSAAWALAKGSFFSVEFITRNQRQSA